MFQKISHVNHSPFMNEQNVYRVNPTISGEKRKAPEGKLVLGRVFEIPFKKFPPWPRANLFKKRLYVMNYEDKD